MKTQVLLGSVAVAVSSALIALPALARPIQVPAPIERIFVPEGFDDNDNVEVVLYGEFPNSCYRVDNVRARANTADGRIEVEASALRYQGEICAQVVTPFIKPVSLGLLEAGDYEAVVSHAPAARANVNVGVRRTESPDDYIYAPVTSASLRWEEGSTKQLLNVKGTYPLTLVGCAVITDVRISLTQGDVVVAQPIMDFVDDERCDNRDSQNFDEDYVMPTAFTGKGLLHVRVMNGNSLNTLLDIAQ